MLIRCPHCGVRPSEEFTPLGDASVVRPASNDPSTMDQWFDYVFIRENPKGPMHEYWHHSGGCRGWLVAQRNTVTHEFIGETVSARDWIKSRSAG